MRTWMKEKRIELGLTQQNVVDCIGVTKQYYRLIEGGKSQKDLCSSLVMSIAKCFNISPIDVVNKESEVMKEG